MTDTKISQEFGKARASSVAADLEGTGKDKSTQAVDAKKPLDTSTKESDLIENHMAQEHLSTSKTPGTLARELIMLMKETKGSTDSKEKEQTPDKGIKVQGIFALLDDIMGGLKDVPKSGEAPAKEDQTRLELKKAENKAMEVKAKESGRDPTQEGA